VTVCVSQGRGGPLKNGEFLAGPRASPSTPRRTSSLLRADTDGIDGTGDNAGAIVTPDTPCAAPARGPGFDPLAARLAANDTYPGIRRRSANLVMTGPTRTNVNDFRAILLT